MTLADFGVVTLDMVNPLPEDPVCILIRECYDWGEVQDILAQNKKTHPDDRIWICRSNDSFLVGREKEEKPKS